MNAAEARAQAIAALSHRLRGRGVDQPETKAAIYLADMTKAGWVWMSPENRPHPPRREDQCDRHPGEWADRCRGCASDQLAQEPTEPRRPRERSADEVSTAVGLARAALIRAKANLCAHGMPTGRCQH